MVNKILLGMALVLFLGTQALAESSVWKVQKGDSVMYLGGTFHLLRPSDFPLPGEFDRAYRDADLLVFETDIGQLKDPAAQQMITASAAYTDGTTIEDYLTESTYRRLAEHCRSVGMPLEKLKQFKPVLVSMAITIVELTRHGVAPEGVDTFYYQRALNDQKPIEKLETVEEQIRFITAMGVGYEDAFINHTLSDLDTVAEKFDQMLTAWKAGDEEALEALIQKELRQKMPIVYKEILLDRNVLWMPMIERFGQTPQKEFILVGVGHLVGPDGIVASLRSKGYRVDKLQKAEAQ